MISSMNAYGGLSATLLLKLFGANSSPAAPSNSTQTGAPPSSQTGLPVASAPDPISTIKSILAQAQMAQSPALTLGGAPAKSAADADPQLQQSVNLPPPAAAVAEAESVSAIDPELAQINQSLAQEGEAVVSAGQPSSAMSVTNGAPGYIQGIISTYTGVESATSVSTASYSWVVAPGRQAYDVSNAETGSAAAANDDDRTGGLDNIQLGISYDDTSVNISFTASGLGQMFDTDNEYSTANPQGDLTDLFQIGIATGNGGYGAFAVNFTGLNATQAQDFAKAFEAATDAPDSTGDAVANGYTYDDNVGNAKIQFSLIVGYDSE